MVGLQHILWWPCLNLHILAHPTVTPPSKAFLSRSYKIFLIPLSCKSFFLYLSFSFHFSRSGFFMGFHILFSKHNIMSNIIDIVRVRFIYSFIKTFIQLSWTLFNCYHYKTVNKYPLY